MENIMPYVMGVIFIVAAILLFKGTRFTKNKSKGRTIIINGEVNPKEERETDKTH